MIDKPLPPRSFSKPYLPGSSAVEQVTVNHFVVGSIPTRAAILRTPLRLLAHGLRPEHFKISARPLNQARRMAPSPSRNTHITDLIPFNDNL